jgi:hypothetical protein
MHLQWPVLTQEGAQEDESDTMRQFCEAAERLQKQRHLEQLSADGRIVHCLKVYMQEWKEDLERRLPKDVNTTLGLQVGCALDWPACPVRVCVLHGM